MAPFDDRMGFRCDMAGAGQAVYSADAGTDWHNPTGRLHGGFVASLADAAMGAAFLAGLAEGESGTNIDLNVRFLRRVDDGLLIARAQTVKSGSKVSLLACEIEDSNGNLVAVAQSQFLRL